MAWTIDTASPALTSDPQLLAQFYAANPNFRNQVSNADVIAFMERIQPGGPPGSEEEPPVAAPAPAPVAAPASNPYVAAITAPPPPPAAVVAPASAAPVRISDWVILEPVQVSPGIVNQTMTVKPGAPPTVISAVETAKRNMQGAIAGGLFGMGGASPQQLFDAVVSVFNQQNPGGMAQAGTVPVATNPWNAAVGGGGAAPAAGTTATTQPPTPATGGGAVVNPATTTPAPVPAPATTTPPTAASGQPAAPTTPGTAAGIRPDLQNNWNLAQAAQWGQPVYGQVPLSNYIKSFATLADYVSADAAGNRDYATRSQATAVIPGNGPPTGGGATTTTPAGPTPAQTTALNAALAAYRAKPGNENGTAETMLGWWAGNVANPANNLEQLPEDFALLTALADTGNQQAIQILDAAGYENTSPTENLPIEQGLLNQALPGLLGDVEGDAGRRTLAATLSGQATSDYEAARNLLSPEENARRLQAELAQADVTTGAISDSSATAAAEQLAALQASIAAMQGNLTGDLAAKALALQQQVAAFTANLNTFDATQKAALAEQIAATQRNLEQSVGAQRQALATEITALRGAADAQSVARRAALQKEIDGLTAAQAPMAQARLDSANALTTAVNLGLEATNDALTAQRAKQGYIGSSTFSDAAQTRATIAARQQAAGVMGGAREANAADLRTINSRGATEGRTLADEYANNLLTISGREATGGRSLEDVLAQGTQAIGDTGAAGTATIKSNTGTGLMNIGNAGAGQSYQDQVVGSSQLKALLDSLATGSAGISSTRTTQQQAARDLGTTAKQGYFDNAYTRGLAGTLARPGLATNLVGTLDAFGNYGNSGLNRTQQALSWWGGNPGTAPAPGYVPAVVDGSGNDIAGLGAGLLGSAFNVANANSWWQKPVVKNTSTSSFGT